MCKYLHSHSLHTTHPPPLPHPPGVAHKRFPSSVLFQFLWLVVWHISLIIDSENSTEWRTSNQIWSCTYIYIKMYICIITKTDRHSNALQLYLIIYIYVYIYDHLNLFLKHLYLLPLPKNFSILVHHYGVKVFLQNRPPEISVAGHCGHRQPLLILALRLDIIKDHLQSGLCKVHHIRIWMRCFQSTECMQTCGHGSSIIILCLQHT